MQLIARLGDTAFVLESSSGTEFNQSQSFDTVVYRFHQVSPRVWMRRRKLTVQILVYAEKGRLGAGIDLCPGSRLGLDVTLGPKQDRADQRGYGRSFSRADRMGNI